MAEYPPNLDDGELWLPSDIIRDVGERHPPLRRRRPPPPPAGYDYVEGLAHQLAALRLLEARAAAAATLAKPSPAPPPPPRFAPVDFELGLYGRLRDKALSLHCNNGGGFRPLGYNLVKPVERFGGPARRFGPAVSGGGPRRESSGTGVFFPRVKYDGGEAKPAKKKTQVVRGGVEQQKQQHNNRSQVSTKNGGVVVLKHQLQHQQQQLQLQHQASMLFQPQTEMALPADWTY